MKLTEVLNVPEY